MSHSGHADRPLHWHTGYDAMRFGTNMGVTSCQENHTVELARLAGHVDRLGRIEYLYTEFEWKGPLRNPLRVSW